MKQECTMILTNGETVGFTEFTAINISENWVMIIYKPDVDYIVYNRKQIANLKVRENVAK